MAAYIVRRLLWLGLTLLFISLGTFVLMHSVKGGPWDTDRAVSEQQIENLNRKYGLDEPMWRAVHRPSSPMRSRATSASLSSARTSPSPASFSMASRSRAVLGLLAYLLAAGVGVTLGVYAALHRNRLPDYGSTPRSPRWAPLFRPSCWASFSSRCSPWSWVGSPRLAGTREVVSFPAGCRDSISSCCRY